MRVENSEIDAIYCSDHVIVVKLGYLTILGGDILPAPPQGDLEDCAGMQMAITPLCVVDNVL